MYTRQAQRVSFRTASNDSIIIIITEGDGLWGGGTRLWVVHTSIATATCMQKTQSH